MFGSMLESTMIQAQCHSCLWEMCNLCVCASAVHYFSLDHFSHFNPAAHFSFRQLKVKDVSIPSSGSQRKGPATSFGAGHSMLKLETCAECVPSRSIKIQSAITEPLSFCWGNSGIAMPTIGYYWCSFPPPSLDSESGQVSRASDPLVQTLGSPPERSAAMCGPHGRTTPDFPSTTEMSEVLIRGKKADRLGVALKKEQSQTKYIDHAQRTAHLFDNIISIIQHNLYIYMCVCSPYDYRNNMVAIESYCNYSYTGVMGVCIMCINVYMIYVCVCVW